MSPSKLSPVERAFRKREAARLRQQRCRERKKQASLKGNLKERKATQLKKSPHPLSEVTKIPNNIEKSNQNVQPSTYKESVRPCSTHRRPSFNECESFPSLGSEPSSSSEAPVDEIDMIPMPSIIDGSPRSALTNFNSQSPYSQKRFKRSIPQAHLAAPLLTINELDIHHMQIYVPLRKRPSVIDASAPNAVELDAVDAMLSLKKSEFFPKMTSMFRGSPQQSAQTSNWRCGPLVGCDTPRQLVQVCDPSGGRYGSHLNTMHSHLSRKHLISQTHGGTMMRSEVMIQYNDMPNSGLHSYY